MYDAVPSHYLWHQEGYMKRTHLVLDEQLIEAGLKATGRYVSMILGQILSVI